MSIDLRSDTVTQPTEGMREAMLDAPLGDDVYGEDPSVNALQNRAAAMFGMEAALFCPSGTMTNQIGINISTRPRDEVICFKGAHIYKYEGGGLFANSGVSVKLVDAPQGRLTAQQVSDCINPEDDHFPRSALVALENTVNRGGGVCYTPDVMAEISQLARANGLRMHLDGARLFNAIVANQEDPKAYGDLFDTVSVCLSKGLGCPVGSLLLGSHEDIRKARRVRKSWGGGMRQAGMLAAAGLYALDHHVERLADDHRRASHLADALQQHPAITQISEPQTNIVLAWLDATHADKLIADLAGQQIRVSAMDKGVIRFVTHLDISDDDLAQTISVLQKWRP